MHLEPTLCYRALEARDARFDGLFFVGVASTGIYCRCVCPAKLPKFQNCTFFATPANAELKGFRPCLRCRPENAPGGSSVDAYRSKAKRAAKLIDRGVLETMSLSELAGTVGISDRQLRRVMVRELGVGPFEYAQTHRLLLAKKLLTDTRLPVGEIALASGFQSVRRLNSAFLERYALTPSGLRNRKSRVSSSVITCELSFRPPFDWHYHLEFLRSRQITGVEKIDDANYQRVVGIGLHEGFLTVSLSDSKCSLILKLSESLSSALPAVVERVRRLFDLDANPSVISAALGELSIENPGLRLPGAFDGFETAVRAILGQQVSVAFATTLAGRIAAAFGKKFEYGDEGLNTLFPSSGRLAACSQDEVASLGVTGSRARAIIALAQKLEEGTLKLSPLADFDTTRQSLLEIPGIGPWTAEYICLRALSYPDAFPAQDLGVLKALNTRNPTQAAALMHQYRPWRAYAVMHLWRSLRPSQSTIKTSNEDNAAL